MTDLDALVRPDLVGQHPYGAPQLDVAVALNVNENSYPVPDDVARLIAQRVGEIAPGLNRYPDREFGELRAALASYLTSFGTEISSQQVWAANGSNEVLLHVLQAFGGPGRVALGFTPSYSMHPEIARTTGTTFVSAPRHAWDEPDPFGLTIEEAVAYTEQTAPNVIFLTSPNNPTGTAMSLDFIAAVYDAAPQAIVIVDEAYAEFARDRGRSALQLLASRTRLAVSRTMSKAFALAGARVGYLAADPDLIDRLRLVRLPYHLSAPTQAVALAALSHASTMLATVDAIRSQRDRIVTTLPTMGLAPVPSDANFVLFGGLADAQATWSALLERGILIRDVGIPHHLRVTAGTPEETDSFLATLTDLQKGAA